MFSPHYNPRCLCRLRIACSFRFFFFFNDTATTEIYTLSLHDALPICWLGARYQAGFDVQNVLEPALRALTQRSEEHTSELQSRQYLVCRLLLEKKKNTAGATT